MTDVIHFSGVRSQVINQLTKYMSKEDAEKFFANQFKKKTPVANRIPRAMSSSAAAACRKTTYVPDASNAWYRGSMPHFTQHAHGLRRFRNLPRRLTESEIANVSVMLGNRSTKKYYLRVFTKLAFVAAALALDITLYCTIGFSPLGTVVSAASISFASQKRTTNHVVECILSVVEACKILPPYSYFEESDCKNMNLECPYQNQESCNITKGTYVNVVNELVREKLIIIE